MIHELKIYPEYFNEVEKGNKTFELRKNDRDFKAGDTLILKEWKMATSHARGPKKDINQEQCYTGREITKIITYVLKGGMMGLHKSYVILGMK